MAGSCSIGIFPSAHWIVGDGFFGFDLDDDNDNDGDDNDITNAFFVSQVDSVAGDIEPEGFFFG